MSVRKRPVPPRPNGRVLLVADVPNPEWKVWRKQFPTTTRSIWCCPALPSGNIPRRNDSILVGWPWTAEFPGELQARKDSFDRITLHVLPHAHQTLEALARLFPLLQAGGTLEILNLPVSYQPQLQGGLFNPYSLNSFLYRLVDLMHQPHWGMERTSQDFLHGFARVHGVDLAVSRFTGLGSVSIHPDRAVLTKGTATIAKGRPLKSGTNESPWGQLPRAPAELYEEMKGRLSVSEAKVRQVEQDLRTIEDSKLWRAVVIQRWVLVSLLNVVKSPVHIFRRFFSEGPLVSLGKFMTFLRRDGPLGLLRRALKIGPISFAPPFRNYPAWIRDHEPPLRPRHGRPERITFSVVLPTYNARPDWLKDAVASVQKQSFVEWELCIADDASTQESSRTMLAELEKSDPRIRVKWRPVNGHISAASNSALELARGEWLVLLDHDDLLHPDALSVVHETIQRNPGASVVFSDEDKLDEAGVRAQPYFKSGFDPDLLLGINMVSHLGCYRRRLVNQIGGFRTGYEGAQDYDLVLRCLEQVGPSEIVHIPRVLYHWRIHGGSTADARGDAKPYATDARRLALEDHLRRTGQECRIEDAVTGFRLHMATRPSLPSVTVLVPIPGDLPAIPKTLPKLLTALAGETAQVLLLTADKIPETMMKGLPIHGPRMKNLALGTSWNRAAALNLGLQGATGDVLVILDPRLKAPQTRWLPELATHATRAGVGTAGVRLLDGRQRIVHAGLLPGLGAVCDNPFPQFEREAHGYYGRIQLLCSYGALTGACLAFERKKALAIGGFDAEHLPHFYPEIDFCFNMAKSGLRNVYVPTVELTAQGIHPVTIEDPRSQPDACHREEALMTGRWGTWIQSDAGYNPNLSLKTSAFSLAFPPRR